MKIRLLLISLFLAFVLLCSGCAKQPSALLGDEPAVPAQAAPEQETAPPVTEEVVTPPEQALPVNPEIEALVAKADKVASYSFTNSKTKQDVWIRGDKVKMYVGNTGGADLSIVNKEKFDTVYLDMKAKAAYGICVELVKCNPRDKVYYRLNYDDFAFVTPLEQVESLMKQGEVKVTGSQMCENRKCLSLSYDSDGSNMVMMVSELYGMPYELRMIKEDGTKDVIESYQGLAFNSIVTDKDVTLPSDYTLSAESAYDK